MFFTLLIIILILICAYEYLERSSKTWKLLNKYPGDYSLPIFGNGLLLGFDSDESSNRLLELWKKHGKTNFRMKVGSQHWLVLTNPDDVATILNHPTEIRKQVERNTGMTPLFGNSLSTSEGERWRTMRKLMTPSFQFKTLEKKVELVNENCDRLFRILDNKDNCVVDMYRYLKPYMFDIVCDSLMGVNMNMLNQLDHPYIDASDKAMEIITKNYFSYWRSFQWFLHYQSVYKEAIRVMNILRGLSSTIITKRKEKLKMTIDNNNNNGKDKIIKNNISPGPVLLDTLLISNLPEHIINEEVTLVCWTGHHTTTTAMAHTLYCIAKHPDVQQRLFEEQRLIFNKDINKKPTYQNLNEMKYLEAVIKESIRIIPTITIISRHLNSDLTFKDGRVAPAGSTVIVFYRAMYQDPKMFPEPEKFNPERFFTTIHNYAFVPFSAGPRNCIAFRFAWAAIKTTMSNIIRRYEISLAGPGTEPQFIFRLITDSRNGIHIKLRKR